MALRRAELGVPHYTVCLVCQSERAVRYAIVTLTDNGVDVEPWTLTMCRDCGRLIKTQLLPAQEET